ncbi:T-cell surface glycoprotein YE1/48-like isoform X1 [Meles meles]|uniref:T-cell surface glycoprotein YE1/48-like isoform X1 n=1 Tax=Meles meles TaxID=9662 RepID=UPI001E69F7DB|nr:T-cell surface glycoprotein YE1/48-like isoform X1 [Meles meles]
MSEERVTYAELNLPNSRKQKGKRRRGNKKRGFPCHIVVLSLGVMCVILLLAITGIRSIFFQKCPSHTIQNKNDTKEKNASLGEVEDDSIFPPFIDKDSDSFQGKWHCCGKSCYYFSKEEKTWEESKKSCEDLSSSLIKIDNKAEQNFIQSKISYNYWTGLHKIGANHPWKWLDGTPLSQMVNFQQSLRDAKCGHLKPSTLSTIDCQKPFHYICEKMFTGPCY